MRKKKSSPTLVPKKNYQRFENHVILIFLEIHQAFITCSKNPQNMYRYLSRALRRAHNDIGKFAGGHERLQFAQAFYGIQDFGQFGRINKSGTKHAAQIQIINALQLGQRNKAKEMLVELSCANESSNAEDFDYILEYCARTPDPLFVMEAWKILVNNEIDMKKKSYRCIIEAFCKGGYLKEAFEWLASLEEGGHFHADLPLFNLVLRECVTRQSLIDVCHCLELMSNRLLGRSEITYWELLKHSVVQKSLLTVHEIWKDCIKHYTPSIIILRKFVWSFTRLHDLESAYQVLQCMVSQFKRVDTSLMKSSVGRYQSSRLDIPIPPFYTLSDAGCFQTITTSKSVKVEDVFGALDVKGKDECSQLSTSVTSGHKTQYLLDKKQTFDCLVPREAESTPAVNMLRWSFNDLIHYCSQSGNWELAELLFLQMQVHGIKPSPHTYDGLIRAVAHGRSLAYGLELMELMEIKGMVPCNDTLANLSIEHSKVLDLNMAECLLERIYDNHSKYIHPFNAFLVACDIMDEPERAIHTLAKLKRLNIRPNIKTFEVLFSLFGNVNAPYERGNWPSHMHAAERIRHIEMAMRRYGVRHSYMSMKNLVRALGMEGMIPEMLQRLENAETFLAMEPHQITDLYNIVLHALAEAGHSLTAIEYFRSMRSYGFLSDAATYHIMIECCSLVASFRSALALTSLMIRDGFIPQIMTYTALVKVLLATRDFHGALDVFNQATCNEIKLDVHLCNEILQQACLEISEEDDHPKGLIDVIECILEQMRRHKVKPDPSTCACACFAYAELGFHSTAVEALRVLSLRMISDDDDDSLQVKMTAFEDLVSSEDPDVESKIVSIFNGGEEHIAIGLLNLRLCNFMTGHQLSFSPEESLWTQRLSQFSMKEDALHLLS
ncbi:Pentatricopeptide repeat-containing protein [Platanthera zijinensis]|uniref:Pentatricopeptide repeat-containing protein n=1 Tax=Platanthera zijinensis TaxID=2320716 RepID=A0AAP0B9N5_9ASPA